MPETTPLIKAALNLRVGAGFDVYQMPVGILIITNILAMDCAIICVIIKINMATNDVLIAFFVLILFLLYNFRF